MSRLNGMHIWCYIKKLYWLLFSNSIYIVNFAEYDIFCYIVVISWSKLYHFLEKIALNRNVDMLRAMSTNGQIKIRQQNTRVMHRNVLNALQMFDCCWFPHTQSMEPLEKHCKLCPKGREKKTAGHCCISCSLVGDHMHVIIVHTLYVHELKEGTYKVLMSCLPDNHGNGDIIQQLQMYILYYI